MRIKRGIFGGTFNPPHNGHRRLAEHFFTLLGLDVLMVIPSNLPPHKQAKQLACGSDRLEMCRRTFTQSGFETSSIETSQSGKSYTYDTLCKIKELYPGDELFLIIGCDMLLSFDKWYRYRDIISMCTLCSARRVRSGVSLEERLPECLRNAQLVLSSLEPFEISSTELRKMLREGNPAAKDFVTPAVHEYIEKRGLYHA